MLGDFCNASGLREVTQGNQKNAGLILIFKCGS